MKRELRHGGVLRLRNGVILVRHLAKDGGKVVQRFADSNEERMLDKVEFEVDDVVFEANRHQFMLTPEEKAERRAEIEAKDAQIQGATSEQMKQMLRMAMKNMTADEKAAVMAVAKEEAGVDLAPKKRGRPRKGE